MRAITGARQAALGPLVDPTYRRIWSAQMASNVGTWAQTSVLQWFMLPFGPVMVAAVQAVAVLPVIGILLPAGRFCDRHRRKPILVWTQLVMLACSVVLVVVGLQGRLQPVLVLVLLFLIGCGQAFMAPAWYAVQPQLVPPHQLPQAAALNSTSMNLARIVGPIAGASLAQAAGIAGAFALNSLSYVGTTVVFGRWREPARTLATATGGRIRDAVAHVWHDRVTVTVLWRLVSFGPVSGVIWPLLPVYAAQELGADANGYSMLLAAFGAGAGVTAFCLPAVHRVFTQDSVHRWACWVFAAVLLALPAVHSLVLACALLVPAAFMAIAALATLSAAMQRSLGDDMRARGMSIYQILLQGGMGVGGLAWGVLADLSGVRATFAVAAAGLLVSGLSASVIRLDGTDATAGPGIGKDR